MKKPKLASVSYNACLVNSPSLFPDSLKRVISNLRLWGVYCQPIDKIVYHSILRTDCLKFVKSTSRHLGSCYVVRFDSAY